jgi:hypothetical protein
MRGVHEPLRLGFSAKFGDSLTGGEHREIGDHESFLS